MRNAWKRIGLLALTALVAVAAGLLRPGLPSEQSEAGFFSPGGLAALPSALPAFPAVLDPPAGADQPLPALTPASGPGSFAIVTALCAQLDTDGDTLWDLDECGDPNAVAPTPQSQGVAPHPTVTFTMNKVFPPDQPVAATFEANGEQELICTDDASCDLTDPASEAFNAQHVAVGLVGGGVNEVVEVMACYADGDCRGVWVGFVETILIVPPLESAAATGPILIAYKCDDVGRYTAPPFDTAGNRLGVPWNTPNEISWEDVFDNFFAGVAGPILGTAYLRRDVDRPFYSCGGDTSTPVDDRVTFETDGGILSVDSLAAAGGDLIVNLHPDLFRPFGTLSSACDAGDSVDVRDHPGPVADVRGGLFFFTLPPLPEDWCDINFAPDGVVGYTLEGVGKAQVATITAQQSGVGPHRSSNVSFTGLPNLTLLLETPPMVGIEGGQFSMAVVDSSLRPTGGVTVACSAEPKDAVLKIVPQTGTTEGIFDANPGQVVFTLYPTRSAVEEGLEVEVTCYVDSDPDKTTGPITVQLGNPAESVNLLSGCNFVSWTGSETEPVDLAGRVAPADNLEGLWAQQPSPEWKGFSPEFPDVSDMGPVSELDVIAVCMSDQGTFTRPAV